MTRVAAPRRTAAELAAAAAAVLAIDPVGVGGARVVGPAGPARDAWLAHLRALLPPDAPLRRLPAGATLDRLLGGLDLPATLAAGRPVLLPGVLASADGGLVVVHMAERLDVALAGPLAAALDRGEVAIERDGLAARAPSRAALVLLDEGEGDEAPPVPLLERAGLHVELRGVHGDPTFPAMPAADLARARARRAIVRASEAQRRAVVEAALAMGVTSLRAPLFALRAAEALAALDGDGEPQPDHLELAVALVLLPRAVALPVPDDAREPPPPPDEGANEPEVTDPADTTPLADRLVDAVRASLPPDLLDLLVRAALRSRASGRSRSGAVARSIRHGRPVGSRPGDPRRGARLDLLATIRSAAPWQRLRGAVPGDAGGALRVRKDDLRVRRLVQKVGTTVIFAVDASGSSALARLNEAKGAVELLLAESYVRRDRVALLVFRGTAADLLLPPTRSLTRARRALAATAGGGGTPLASALDAARVLAQAVRRGGGSPLLVLLTDGRANVRRDGTGGRPAAEDDARAGARALAADAVPALLIDTSPRPNPFARELAGLLGGAYLPLPAGDARRVGTAVRAAMGTG